MTLLVLLPVTVLMGVLGIFAIPLLYGDEFRASVTPFILLLPGVLCLAVWYIVGLFLIANFKRPGLTTRIQLIGLSSECPSVSHRGESFRDEWSGGSERDLLFHRAAWLSLLQKDHGTATQLFSAQAEPISAIRGLAPQVRYRTLLGKRARAT